MLFVALLARYVSSPRYVTLTCKSSRLIEGITTITLPSIRSLPVSIAVPLLNTTFTLPDITGVPVELVTVISIVTLPIVLFNTSTFVVVFILFTV